VGLAFRPAYTPPPSPDWTVLRVLLGSLAVAVVFSLWLTRTGNEGESGPPPTTSTLTSTAEEVESVKRIGQSLRQMRESWPPDPMSTAKP
jgi:hypothetical protein